MMSLINNKLPILSCIVMTLSFYCNEKKLKYSNIVDTLSFGDKNFRVSFDMEENYVQDTICTGWGTDFARCYRSQEDTIYLAMYINSLANLSFKDLTEDKYRNNFIYRIKDHYKNMDNLKPTKMDTFFKGYLLGFNTPYGNNLEYMGYKSGLIEGYELTVRISSQCAKSKAIDSKEHFTNLLESIKIQ